MKEVQQRQSKVINPIRVAIYPPHPKIRSLKYVNIIIQNIVFNKVNHIKKDKKSNKIIKNHVQKEGIWEEPVRFDYPSLNNKKRTHYLLKNVRDWVNVNNEMSLNQKRVIKEPDHFVSLFTGDQAKKLHDQRTIARNYNKEIIIGK